MKPITQLPACLKLIAGLFFCLVFSPCLSSAAQAQTKAPSADQTSGLPITLQDSCAASVAPLPKVNDSTLARSFCQNHPQALQGITIMLDAGHGGGQLGAHFGPVEEKSINLSVAVKLRARLAVMGAKVIMTRTDDSDITLEGRVNESIAVRPDIFVSVHSNANSQKSLDGIETYYFGSRSRPLAVTLLGAISRGLQERPNWVKQQKLFVCHHNIVPSTLVEIGYLSNARTKALLITDDYQERAAESIAIGIFDYFRHKNAARGCIMNNATIARMVQEMKHGMLVHSTARKGRSQAARKRHHDGQA